MARIRSIKPDFFVHERLQELEQSNPGLHCMLVFAGLWTLCDKAGNFEWKPRHIKLDILPFIEFDIRSTLAILEGASFFRRYSVDGKEYGHIPSFGSHQKITGTEKMNPPRFPAPPEGPFMEPLGNPQGTDKEEQERERERERERSMSPLPAEATPTPKAKRFVKPTVDEVAAYCRERGNGIDPQEFIDSNDAKGWRVGKTQTPMKDWQAAIRTWESVRAKGFQQRAGPVGVTDDDVEATMREIRERRARDAEIEGRNGAVGRG